MIKDNIKLNKNYEDLFLRCPLCNDKYHFAVNCAKVHYIPDRELILKK